MFNQNIKLFLFNLLLLGVIILAFYSSLWIYIINLIMEVYNKSYYLCNEVMVGLPIFSNYMGNNNAE